MRRRLSPRLFYPWVNGRLVRDVWNPVACGQRMAVVVAVRLFMRRSRVSIRLTPGVRSIIVRNRARVRCRKKYGSVQGRKKRVARQHRPVRKVLRRHGNVRKRRMFLIPRQQIAQTTGQVRFGVIILIRRMSTLICRPLLPFMKIKVS